MEHRIGKFSAVWFQSFLIMVYIFCYIPCICEFCCIVISYCSVFTALEFLVVLIKFDPCLYPVREIPCNGKFEGSFFFRKEAIFIRILSWKTICIFSTALTKKISIVRRSNPRFILRLTFSITGKVIPEILYSIHPFAVKPLCFIGYIGSTGQNRHISIP